MTKYAFYSSYKEHFSKYLEFRVSNGYKINSFYYLFNFDKFLKTNNYNKSYIDEEIVYKYYNSSISGTKNSKIERLKHIVPFLKYLKTIGIDTYIPSVIGKQHKSKPYVLTHKEIIKLFEEIDKYFINRKNTYYNYEYPILFRLLYTTGMRIGETCSLKLFDVNISDKTIQVIAAKNSKDRIVYLSNSMAILLDKYINMISCQINSEWLFPSLKSNGHLDKTTVDGVFKAIITKANIGNRNHHPVPHSLRHTYVVHRIDLWLKEGKSVDELIPYLSKQLGHSSIEETYYYYHTISSSFNSIKDSTNELYPEVENEKE